MSGRSRLARRRAPHRHRYVDAVKALTSTIGAEALGGIVRDDFSGAGLLWRVMPALRPKLGSAELRTQRDRLLASARVAFEEIPPESPELRHIFKFTFAGEQGIDAGGLARESDSCVLALAGGGGQAAPGIGFHGLAVGTSRRSVS